jgi:teichuronic acid exporter
MSELKRKTLNGLVWTFVQQFGFQLVNFVVSIILARLLLPESFGIIGMISVFIALGKSLVDSGMATSLIRTEAPSSKEYSTVFFANLMISILAYLLVFFLAPLVADFFQQPILVDLLRLYCVSFVIAAFSGVQSTRLNKEMRFKTQFLINVPSLILGSVLGIVLAYLGYGVWSLVWMNISQTAIATIQLWLFSNWKPNWVFDKESFKKHYSFGMKLTISGILNTIIANLNSIVIGKYFSPAQLGFFTRAKSMQELPFVNISNVLNKVTFPLFSSIGNDQVRLRSVYVRFFELVFFIVTPILTLCILIAEPLFRVLLTEKWLPAVPYFKILCLGGLVTPLNTYNLNIQLVKGKSGQYLYLNVIKNVLIVLGLILVIPFGIDGLLWGMVVTAYVTFFINAFYSGKLLDFSVSQQLRVIYPIVFISFISGTLIYLCDTYGIIGNFNDFSVIVINTLLFLFLVLGLSFLFRIKAISYLKDIYKHQKIN